jgi:transcriptional regulator with XRE-family HTH domain
MSLTDRISSSPERMRSFQRERLATEITELVCELMDEHRISRAELARRLGKSPPYVTKMLRNGSNLTVKTISDVFFALGKSVRIVDRALSINSPRLLVMDVPIKSGSVHPRANYEFAIATTPKGRGTDSPLFLALDYQLTTPTTSSGPVPPPQKGAA